MPKCGDHGFLTKAGKPCGQSISPEARGCVFHLATPEERKAIALKGAFNASLKNVLPEDFEIGTLETPEDMKAFLKRIIPFVLKMPIEKWRSQEARGWFSFLVELDRNRVTEKLADAVLTAQHGGQSLVFLNQFLEGGPDSKRRLPSRRVHVVPADSEGAA